MLSEQQMPTIHPVVGSSCRKLAATIGWRVLVDLNLRWKKIADQTIPWRSPRKRISILLVKDFNNHYRATIHAMNQGFESPLRNNAMSYPLVF